MATRVDEAKYLSIWIEEKIDDLDIPNNWRVLLATTSLHLAFEHAGSLLVLTENHRHGSAAALVRPTFEACVRGAWLYYCATNEELEQFRRTDKIQKFTNTLIDELEQHGALGERALSEIKSASWSAMCSMTHGGIAQLSRRVTATEITARNDGEHADTVISSAVSACTMVGIMIANIAGNPGLAREISEGSQT